MTGWLWAVFTALDLLIFGWRAYGCAFAGACLALLSLAAFGDSGNAGTISVSCVLGGLVAGFVWEHFASPRKNS